MPRSLPREFPVFTTSKRNPNRSLGPTELWRQRTRQAEFVRQKTRKEGDAESKKALKIFREAP